MKKFNKNKRSNSRHRAPRKEVEGTAVIPYDGERTDSLMRRFKRVVESSGVLKDLKEKRYHLSKGEKKKLKRERAEKRRRKREVASKRYGD